MDVIDLDVAVIGAGTAGLYAYARAARKSDKVLLFEGGPQGTMCARKGCMPSKAFILAAERAHLLRQTQPPGIPDVPAFGVDFAKVMEEVRRKRDYLSGRTADRTNRRFGEKIVTEYVRFAEPMVLETEGGTRYRCGAVVIATGSAPVVPPGWQLISRKIVTTEEFFELPDLPKRVLVVGMGPIGMELGQAMARAGISVTAVQRTDRICGIQDPKVLAAYKKALDADGLAYLLNSRAELIEAGDTVRVAVRDLKRDTTREMEFDLVLLGTGRRPYLSSLDMENAGLELDEKGMPAFDPKTLMCKGQNVYIAGDASGLRLFFHDAADQGMRAGISAGEDAPAPLAGNVPLVLLFTHPQIAMVGRTWDELDPENTVCAELNPATTGRGVLEEAPEGVFRVYFEAGGDNRLLGAEMVSYAAEHLCHTLAVLIEAQTTLDGLLEHPFYHPTFEEMIQGAAVSAKVKAAKGRTLAKEAGN